MVEKIGVGNLESGSSLSKWAGWLLVVFMIFNFVLKTVKQAFCLGTWITLCHYFFPIYRSRRWLVFQFSCVWCIEVSWMLRMKWITVKLINIENKSLWSKNVIVISCFQLSKSNFVAEIYLFRKWKNEIDKWILLVKVLSNVFLGGVKSP